MDSSAVYVTAVGSSFRFDKQDIKIKNNLISFDKYNIYASGTNPFVVDGTIDIHNLSRMTANLKLTAHDMQLLNVKRNKESMVYGKLLVNLNSTVKGPLNALIMRGDLQLLGGTNVTYVMQESPTHGSRPLSRPCDLYRFLRYAADPPAPAGSTSAHRRTGHVDDDPDRPGRPSERRYHPRPIEPCGTGGRGRLVIPNIRHRVK